MLTDRVMRGKEGSELQARHGVLSGVDFLLVCGAKLRAEGSERNREMSRAAECRHAYFFSLSPQARRGENYRVILFHASSPAILYASASVG
jgi:hypothetical protein